MIKNNKVVTHTQTRIPKLYIGLWVVLVIILAVALDEAQQGSKKKQKLAKVAAEK